LKTLESVWSLSRGALVLPDGALQFSGWAPKACRLSVEETHRWLTLTPTSTGSTLHAGFNFSPNEQSIGLQGPGSVALLLSSDDPAYGGKGELSPGSNGLVLPPFSAGLMRVA